MTFLGDRVLSHLKNLSGDSDEVWPEPGAAEVPEDRYELGERAGAGGMGEVFRALDRDTGKQVAVKLLHQRDERAYERFRREACVLAEVDHPGIVRYLAHGKMGGRPFIAMEWIEGETLGARMERLGLTLGESVALTRRLAEALGFAHGRGVVHRDVKPGNVLLPDGDVRRAMLVDFGVARPTWLGATITSARVVVGTPGYMSPEQARGSAFVDPRADVFALGCILYRCLTGRRAFGGDDLVAVLAKIVFTDPPSVRELCPGVPSELAELVRRMLAKDAAVRPADGTAVASELGAFASVDLQWRAPAGSIFPAITDGEQRFASVVALAPRVRARALAAEQVEWVECVRRFGAKLELLADGTAMAVVASRTAGADHAAQAARCALSLRELLPRVPMVLATGRAVLSGGAPSGQVIDRAADLLRKARVPKAAAPVAGAAPVMLDEVTAGLLDARFQVTTAVGLYRLDGPERTDEPVRTLLGRPSPCVGRQRELSVLEGIYEESVTEPVARAVLLTAAAGMGKSRLRHELCRRLTAREHPPRIWTARGDPLRAGAPFGLLSQAVRQGLGIAAAEPLPKRQAALLAGVERMAPAAERERWVEFLGELAGTPVAGGEMLAAARRDPTLMAEQLQRAWLDFVRAACAERPLLLVLEDLHWGDLPTVSYVDRALGHLEQRPLMVLALARPEVRDLFPRLWAERDLQDIRLTPLGRRAAEMLVRDALGTSVEGAPVAEIVERADGNAFFLEELVRGVAEGRHDAAPETVLAVLEARLGRLEPDARRVLRAGSVFGRAFAAAGAQALLGDVEVQPWIDLLVDRELLARSAERRLEGTHELVFRHALVRETAYAMLTDEDRQLGHRLAAAWLAESGDTEPMALAEHHHRGGEPEQASGFYALAAEEALRGSDLAAAVDRAERAVACGASRETLGRLRLLQAEACRWGGDTQRAVEHAEDAAALLPRGSADWFRAAGELCLASGRLGEYDLLERVVEDAMSLDVDDATKGAQIVAFCPAATQLLQAGRTASADRMIGRIESMARSASLSPLARARLDQLRGFQALRAGNPAHARRAYRDAYAAFQRAGSMRNTLIEQINSAHASIELGLFEEAEESLRGTLAPAEALGLSAVRAFAQLNLGRALAGLGRHEEARSAELIALEIGRAESNPRIEGASRIHLSRIALSTGDAAEAEREARAAVELLEVAPPLQAGALAALASALCEAGRADEALEPARRGRDIVAAGGSEMSETAVRLAYADALARNGDAAAARSELESTAARLRAQASRFDDPALAEAYLARVEDNARVIRLTET